MLNTIVLVHVRKQNTFDSLSNSNWVIIIKITTKLHWNNPLSFCGGVSINFHFSRFLFRHPFHASGFTVNIIQILRLIQLFHICTGNNSKESLSVWTLKFWIPTLTSTAVSGETLFQFRNHSGICLWVHFNWDLTVLFLAEKSSFPCRNYFNGKTENFAIPSITYNLFFIVNANQVFTFLNY